MIIECTIRRDRPARENRPAYAGTHVDKLFGKNYFFRPVNEKAPHVKCDEATLKALVESGAHVCEVEDKKAIGRLLGIDDGEVYRIFDPAAINEAVPEPEPARPAAAPIEGRGRRQTVDDDPDDDPEDGADSGDDPDDGEGTGDASERALKPVKFDPTTFKNKKAMVEWAEANFEGIKLNPKLPEGRIVGAIRAHIKKLEAGAAA